MLKKNTSKRKKYKITNEMIAQMFGYASANCFNATSAKERILQGIDEIIKVVENSILKKIKE